MPSVEIPSKSVPNWTYPERLREVMTEFEALVETVREEVWKSGRNLRASRRARTSLQDLRVKMIPRVRGILFEEADRMEALRRGVSYEDWKAAKERDRSEKRQKYQSIKREEEEDTGEPENPLPNS